MTDTLSPAIITTTFDEVAQQVIDTINKNIKKYKARVTGFAWSLNQGPVRNSHAGPQNGVQNFGGDKDSPTHYPGWEGRVWIRFSKPFGGFASDTFKGTLTYPGTGGGGAYSGPWTEVAGARYKKYGQDRGGYPRPEVFSWDYRFYADDFPALKAHVDTEQAMHVLRGSSVPKVSHNFNWTDPEVLDADHAFLKSLKKK